ncbi:zinc finger, c3HC4 type (RING finger) domain-containing protein [Ditylenchus destructor]|nr:zinc finger, c3HC4 type (RING finger) domain-containing protein [Ditylenchus destructor]
MTSSSLIDRNMTNRIIPPEMTCFLCKDIYIEPMILSCGHSFCLRCVEKWLRKCTNCPQCRMPSLEPIHNITLTEKIQEHKKATAHTSMFQRSVSKSFKRALWRDKTNKEATAVQNESIRASKRRPSEWRPGAAQKIGKQNVTHVPMSEDGSSLHSYASSAMSFGRVIPNDNEANESLGELKGDFRKMSVLRNSFRRIRRKISSSSAEPAVITRGTGSNLQKDKNFAYDIRQVLPENNQRLNSQSGSSSGYNSNTSPVPHKVSCLFDAGKHYQDHHSEHQKHFVSGAAPNVRSLWVFVLSTAGERFQYIINQAFAKNIDNVEFSEFHDIPTGEAKTNGCGGRQKNDILESILKADCTVILYDSDNLNSAHRLIEFFNKPSVLKIRDQVNFYAIALYTNRVINKKRVLQEIPKPTDSHLADLLGSQIVEIDASRLAQEVPNLLSSQLNVPATRDRLSKRHYDTLTRNPVNGPSLDFPKACDITSREKAPKRMSTSQCLLM